MNKKPATPQLVVDNDKVLLIEVASEFDMICRAIKRERITNGPDSPRLGKLRELHSTALKRVLCKLAQTPAKRRSRSRAKLKLLDQQIDE